LKHPDLWSGISVYSTPEAVRRRARRYRWRGYLARLEIRPSAAIRIAKTLGQHHYTLWGDADALLGCVVYPLLEI
jgi:hypothetical protein